MRILYLAFAELDIPNACRTHVVEVIRNLAELGHRIVVILPKPLAPVQFPDSVKTSYVYPWSFSWFGKLVFRVLAAGQMCYHFIVFRPDVVYEREMGSNPLPALLCWLFKVPLFVEINGVLMDELTELGVGQFRLTIERHWQSRELRAAAGLVIPSDHMRTRIMQEYALSAERCAFVLSGFNPGCFSPGSRREARFRLGLPNEAFGLVFVGCMRPGFNLSAYLRLIARLKEEFPHLVLWIVGDGPMRQLLEEEARTLGVEEKVHFVGYQSEAVAGEWIRASNLCLVPHADTGDGFRANGGMATKTYAYAACGRAILLHLGSTQQFPEEMKSLFLTVPIGSDQAIEATIRIAMADPEILDRQGADNAVWVHNNATWAHTAKRTLEFIQERIGKCVA